MTECRALVDPRKIAYVPAVHDSHGAFAVEFYGVCTPETRKWSKTIRFVAAYSMPVGKLTGVLYRD